jgi:predicted transglutaminase-like protease
LSRGAASLTPVDRTHEKTQDFDLIWSETNIEVEVTKSEAKDVHTSLRIQAQRIAQSINSTIGKFDLVVHVSKLLDTATEARLLDASWEITIDQTIEEPNACGQFTKSLKQARSRFSRHGGRQIWCRFLQFR